MSRIAELAFDDWDPRLKAVISLDDIEPMQRQAIGVLAHAPHMVQANTQYMTTAMAGLQLPPRLIELVRLRIAFHNQCRTCMAMRHRAAVDDGLSEDMVCSLERPMEAPNLNDREKVAIEFADAFATDHHEIGETIYDKLKSHFSPAEIIELGLLAGYFLGFGRFLATLAVTEELPKSYQDTTKPIAPWLSAERVIVS